MNKASEIEICIKVETDQVPRSLIRKVSPQLRAKSKTLREGSTSVYDPVMVSLGPYHHGKPELQQAQAFKKICLEHFLGDGRANLENLRDSILLNIDQVRNSYAETSLVNVYDDNALVEMMLLDACFIICYMEILTTEPESNQDDVWSKWRYHLGEAGCHRFAERDIMVLENQIPFFVLKLVMYEKYSDNEAGKNLVAKFLGWALFMKIDKPLEIPREDEDPPLHILGAYRRVFVEKVPTIDQPGKQHKSIQRRNDTDNYYTCGSVTDLKAKGIYCSQSSSHSFQDIKFESHVFYGKLELPVRYICDGTLVNFSNMIAYEICPRSNPTDLAVCSYISLMKSLIQTPADVKELEEAGVFALNRFQNKEQVVEMFKSFDTLDLENKKIYEDVMYLIGRHCKNKIKTWTAYDLIQTKLHSPCTSIGMLVAATIFILTCVSVYYNINPVHQN